MAALTHLSGLRSRFHLPGRTVRARLTWLYGSLFLGSGVVLLLVTALLWEYAAGPVTVTGDTAIPHKILSVTGLIAGRPPNSAWASSTIAGQARHRGERIQVVVGQLRALITQQQSSDLHELLLWSGVALAIMALLAIVLGHLAAGRALRPLRAMTAAAKEISATNLHRRLAMDGPADELKSLGDTFDDLLGRLERSFESQRRFVANASHELRTPLATMRAMLDVTVSKPDPPPPETTRLAERLRQELDRTDGLVDSFLALARAEGGSVEDDERVDLDELVDAALSDQAPAIERMGLTTHHGCSSDAVIEGHRALLARMVANLVDNAVRHNRRDGGWVVVDVTTDGSIVRLTVENDGALLDTETASRLVEPFRRAVTDRTARGDGFGLGLSIVASIAQTHRGFLLLEPLESGGLRAVVELPAYMRHAAEVPV